MKAAEYLAVARRYWYILLAGVLVGVGVAAGISLIQTPSYEATAKAFVSTSYAGSVSDLSQGTLAAQQIVASYADVATTGYVLQPVINELSLRIAPAQLAQNVTVTAPTGTSVIQISAAANNAELSAKIANSVAAQLEKAVARLSPRSDSSAEVKVIQIDRARPSLHPTAPNLTQYIAVGSILGLIAAALALLLNLAADTRVRTSSALEVLTEAPSLGSVDRDNALAATDSVLEEESRSRAAEQLRALRTGLRYVEPDRSSLSLLVTSSVSGEGKTTIAANLAAAMASAGQSTIVIDADLRRPALARKFGLISTPGLTDVLIGSSDLRTAVQRRGPGDLAILPSGAIPPNPQELLQSQRMGELVAELTKAYDNVIIDSPPLLAVADAEVLGQLVGGAILVCATSNVSKSKIAEAVERLRRVNIKLEGSVVTFSKPPSSRGRDSYGYYAHAAQ